MAKKEFIEAARKKHPQYSEQAVEKCILTAFLTKPEIEKMLIPELGKGKAHKLAKLGGGILVSELDETIETFPHLDQDQVLRFFRTEALASPKIKLDGTGITRPMLIELVEVLEEYTGMQLTDDTDAPLRYLDNVSQTLTIQDVAEYFAGVPSRIMCIRSRDRRNIPPMSKRTQAYQRNVVKAYLADCCCGEINEQTPIMNLRSDVADNPYVVVHWLEGRFGKTIDNHFILTKKVGDLLDAFAKN